MTDEDYPSMFNTIIFSSCILLVQYFLALFYALLFLNLAYQITNRSKMFHTLTYTHALTHTQFLCAHIKWSRLFYKHWTNNYNETKILQLSVFSICLTFLILFQQLQHQHSHLAWFFQFLHCLSLKQAETTRHDKTIKKYPEKVLRAFSVGNKYVYKELCKNTVSEILLIGKLSLKYILYNIKALLLSQRKANQQTVFKLGNINSLNLEDIKSWFVHIAVRVTALGKICAL